MEENQQESTGEPADSESRAETLEARKRIAFEHYHELAKTAEEANAALDNVYNNLRTYDGIPVELRAAILADVVANKNATEAFEEYMAIYGDPNLIKY